MGRPFAQTHEIIELPEVVLHSGFGDFIMGLASGLAVGGFLLLLFM